MEYVSFRVLMFMGGLSCIVRSLLNMTLTSSGWDTREISGETMTICLHITSWAPTSYKMEWNGAPVSRVIFHPSETYLFQAIYRGQNVTPLIWYRHFCPYKLVAWVPKAKSKAKEDSIHVFFVQQIKLGENSEKHAQFLGNVLGKFSKSLFGIKCLVGSV